MCGYWSTRRGGRETRPSPEPPHGLMKISASVKMCSLTRRVLLAQGQKEEEGRRRRDVFLPSHSKCAKLSPFICQREELEITLHLAR